MTPPPPARLVDLVITGGLVVAPETTVPAAIAVDQGRIVAIGQPDALPPARETIDATGLFVLPGAIDVHVHFREPGFSHKETWTSATQAAAVGGVTTVFDMPNTDPPTGSVAALEQKHAIAAAQAIVDFGLYGLIGETNLDQLEAMAQAGAASFKLYMGSENPLVPCPCDGAIVEAFEIMARLGIRCTVHAENTPLLSWRGERLRAAGRTDAAAHLEQHIDLAAVEAVSRTAVFAEWTGAKVHIAHESTRHSLPHIRFAKDRGVDMTVETCPHYLFLSTDDGARLGENFMRVKPPVREPGHAGPLWNALLDGTIDILSTDHAPHLRAEKMRPVIWDCAPGFPGVETSMVLMLAEVSRGCLTLGQYVRMACEAPAKAFGLYPRKGVLAVGADADIVLVDMEKTGRVAADGLHSIGNATPFESFEIRGRPVRTLVRGATVALDGRPVGTPGWGRAVTAPR
ncbi:MAG: dihydroorotase family protein [Rhodoplanes sp.]|uniref:dihydroorotase n=1 Tax=Rhodoplanes sp. TaxID=1968906 RepID=UPI00183D1BD4|nr:dihydroorotase family protein [Rhodoplanes sp.]NVO17256.1 dihydroorotase family protein [Rhodoplanes sp.]